MSRRVRNLVSVLALLGLAVAAGIFVKLRNQEMKRPPLPPDVERDLQRETPGLERIRTLEEIRKVLKDAPEEGVRRLRAFIQAAPKSAEASEAHMILADALVQAGDTKGALQELDTVIADPAAHRRASRARLERGRLLLPTDPAAARADFDWVHRDIDHPDLQNAACLELGRLELAKGNYRGAIALLKPLLAINIPEKPGAQEAIRKAILGQTGRLAEAGDAAAVVTWGDEMIQQFPDDPDLRDEVHYRQAGALRQLGRFAEARTVVERLRRRAASLSKDIDCDAELRRIVEAEAAAGITRTRDAFLKAKAAGKDARASLEGPIAADTTWTKAASPLVLTGVATVQAGATLTIEPGVAVQFVLGARLVVEGALVARGTAEAPIRFTSAAEKSPTAFDGEGILFADSSADDRCVLEHCTVEYQRVGVACAAASPAIRRCLFTRNGNVALLATQGAEPRIEDLCRFESNDGVGVRSEGASIALRQCLVLRNGGDGIQLADKSKGTVAATRVRENRGHGVACDNFAAPAVQASEIAANQGDGIHCTRFSQPTIQGNAIRDNAGAGITCLLDSAATITGNLIEGNRTYPLVLEKSDPAIRGNNILRNRPYGLNCAKSASPQIDGNWIEGNGAAGILCAEASAPVIKGNAILGQARAISNTGTMAIDAKGNYFGKVDDTKMEDIIFDKGDEKSLGEVVWRPRLAEPPPRPPQPQLDLPPMP